jgi:hypothetical protein
MCYRSAVPKEEDMKRVSLAAWCVALLLALCGFGCGPEQTRDTTAPPPPTESDEQAPEPAAPLTRYVAGDDGVVTDNETNLEWFVGPDERTTWDEAQAWVEGLSVAGGGWRMPTKDELRGLYQKGLGTQDMTPLLKTTGWWVWSAAEAEGSSQSWGFSFSRDGELVMTSCAHCDSRAFAVRKR